MALHAKAGNQPRFALTVFGDAGTVSTSRPNAAVPLTNDADCPAVSDDVPRNERAAKKRAERCNSAAQETSTNESHAPQRIWFRQLSQQDETWNNGA
jgi:hypothetical protein